MIKEVFIFFSLIIITTNLSISQSSIYLDEQMNEIDSTLYFKKCKFSAFKCIEYKKDTLSINKILLLHYFGTIDKTQNNQIRSILSKDAKRKIDNNSIIIVRYYDSILSYKTMKKKRDVHVKIHEKGIDSAGIKSGIISHHKYNLKTYHRNMKNWLKGQNKCIRKFERIDNVDVFNVINNSQININNLSSISPIKDRNVFKNTFFKILYQYRYLVLKPNGDYFLSGGHLSDKKLIKLLKEKNWENIIEDWEISINRFPINGNGFFKYDKVHQKHCF